jgi:septal ring factor EnvC (AmiA/AmiB activator)
VRRRALLALLPVASLVLAEPPSPQERLSALQRDIARLRREVGSLSGKEQGILGELQRLDTERALKEAELQEVEERLAGTEQTLAEDGAHLQALLARRADRARYLSFRLREIYKRGPGIPLRHLLVEGDDARVLRGLRLGLLLSERDGRQLRGFRTDTAEADRRRRDLQAEQARLQTVRDETWRAREALAAARGRQARFLEEIRGDRHRKERAAEEMETAAREIAAFLQGQGIAATALDPRSFRGVLDWPCPGKVAARFGRTVDARFGTAVPHPGLDLEAAAGTPFRAVLDGKILWSGPLRGYGLTAIVDHGGGLASVYAHAAGLVVEKGEQVTRGQTLGHLGETGERAPYLYFELRDGGKPVDPEGWLRPR